MNSTDFQSLVRDFNETASPYPSERTIAELFSAQAAATPDAEAIRFGAASMTYGELDRESSRFAAYLQAIGVRPRDLVVIFMQHSIDVVCAILATLKAGAAYVPVDTAAPKERLAFMLDDIARASGGTLPLVITQPNLRDRIPASRVTTLEDTQDAVAVPVTVYPHDPAYVIYTSGSTGRPKGVVIEHRSVVNYIWWAASQYSRGERLTWPLFSSLAFDLTVTSIFTPLITGGRIVVYRENPELPGMVVVDVINDNAADIVKLTPAHIAMIRDLDLRSSRIRKFIVGGEDFKTSLARDLVRKFAHPIEIYNEYGPTEATVGCMIHRFDPDHDLGRSVPVGRPAANAGVYILDESLQPVDKETTGEMFLAGDGLARGYFNRPELTSETFITTVDPRHNGKTLRLYKTGDLARWSASNRLEFLGRADEQVKISGARIELGEIEARLLAHPAIKECVVDVVRSTAAPQKLTYCARCGVASNLPGATFDADGVCSLCRAYDTYAAKAEAYFKSRADLIALVEEMKSRREGDYDCLVMLSGGKDSTYMLYQLCALGLRPLVFTLDNGFISDEAKANIDRVVRALGVDHVYGTTPHMNEIFVDSLKRYANVCNGCFKTLYTLTVNLAQQKNIRYIVTGLSRGQFFETRLTAEVFERKDFQVEKLDALVLDARKAYHSRPDAVACHLDVEVFRGDGVFDHIEFVDFYRYWSAPLAEMHEFLRTKTPWHRPSDTGRSTNCLINDLGIYVHKKQRGFHNYALPYSWDVRLGQKAREEAMQELDDEIDEARVQKLMAQIGYEMPEEEMTITRLAAWYVADKPVSAAELREFLAEQLPDYMIPAQFVAMPRMPVTSNGKIDRRQLPAPVEDTKREVIQPRTDTEKVLASIWSQLLNVQHVGIDDDFFELGAQSLLAIRAVSRIRDAFGVDVALRNLFERPTVAGLAEVIDGLSFVANRAALTAQSGREDITL